MTPSERNLLGLVVALSVIANAVIGFILGALSNLHAFR